ncbi:MAG: hypothetical protein KJ592_01685 [Nanoarchaeota archaeon]|nr:hypothetical protein [Nanoarchaeota archaeon]
MMNNKNGISAIVATVLIILITVAAVTIVWIAVIPLVSDSVNEGTECITADRSMVLENKGYTCRNDSDNTINVHVSLGSEDVVLAGVQVLVSTGGSTSSETINDISLLPKINEAKVLTTGVDAAYADATGVSVAPIMVVGGVAKVCTVSREIALVPCL